MAKQTINHGTTAGDGTGESLFGAFKKAKENFDELYGTVPQFVANEAALPATGVAGTVYIALDTGGMYRWGGSTYVGLGVRVQTNPITGATELVGPDGVINVAQWNSTNTALVDPVSGADVPLGGDSILSSTIVTLAAATTTNSNAVVPFDTFVRNDLGLALTGGAIDLPATTTQFRFGYHLKLNGASSGLPGGATAGSRRAIPNIIAGGVGETETLLGIHEVTYQYPAITGGTSTLVYVTADIAGCTLHYQSPWIDVADLTTPLSGIAGEDQVYIIISHNSGAGTLQCQAGSSLWIETMTPA